MTRNLWMAALGAVLGSTLMAHASVVSLNGLFYTWPTSHAAKALANDGSGNLSWTGGVDTGVPSGVIGFFPGTSCPANWTEYTPLRGRYIVATTGSFGGTVGTALSNLENRPAGQHDHPSSSLSADITDSSHGHGTNDSGHTHTEIIGEPNYSTSEGSSGAWDYSYSSNGQTTGISISNANANLSASPNLSITGVSGGVAGTNAPYIQLLACRKS